MMDEAERKKAEKHARLVELIAEGERDLEEGRFTTFETQEELKAFFDSL